MNQFIKYVIAVMVLLVLTIPYSFAQDNELIVVGVQNDYPFMFYDINGRPDGYAVDFITQFAIKEGYDLHIELYPAEEVLTQFEDHGDLLFDGSFYRSIEAEKSLPLFVQEYYLYGLREKTKRLTPDDLHSYYEASTQFADDQFGVKSTQVIDDYVDSLAPHNHIIMYKTISDTIYALIDNKIDYAILPFHQSNSVLEYMNIHHIGFVDQKLYFKNIGYWATSDKILHQLDSFILTKKKSGYITELNNKWLTSYEAQNRESLYLKVFNAFIGISIATILFLVYRSNILQNKVNSKTEQLREKLDENRQLYDEIIRHEKFKNDYFINLSHELRTPLNVILGAIQLNELYIGKSNYEKLLENADNFTQIIKSNSYRLLRVVNNLIDITKMDADKYTLNIDLVDVIYLCEEIVTAIRLYASRKDLEISIESDYDECVVECDPFEIERVIMNLLSNAIKFTPNGGKILVSIRYSDNSESIIIDIQDTGIGISEDNQQKIFDRFAQVDTTLNRNHEGHGIGLFLVKHILSLHGGKISVKSTPDVGSTFTVELPVNTLYTGFDTSGLALGPQHHDRQHAINLEFSEIQQELENHDSLS